MLYLLFTTTILHFFLAVYVYSKGKKRKDNLFFSLFAIGIALWALTNAIFQLATDKNTAYIWAILAYSAATFMLYCLAIFSKFISGKKVTKAYFIGNTLLGILSFVLPYVDHFVLIEVSYEKGYGELITGPGLSVLFFSYLFFIGEAFVSIFLGFRKGTRRKKQQLVYVSIGLAGAVFFGVLFNLVFPSLGNYKYVGLGPTFTLLLLGVIAYAIMRLRLFGIRFVIGRTIYIILVALIPFITFYSVFYVQTKIWGSIYTSGALISGFFVAIAFIYFLLFANNRLTKFINDKIVNPGYDPVEVKDKLVRSLSSELQIDKVATGVLSTIHSTIKPMGSGIIIFDLSDRKILFRRIRDLKLTNGVRDLLEIIYFWDEIDHSIPIIKEEIIIKDWDVKSGTRRRLERIVDFMKQRKIDAIFPLNRKVQLNGILLLGDKSDESAYTVQDVDFIETIVANASVAIGRALLHKEVQDFAGVLEDKVDFATKKLRENLEALKVVRQRERDMLDIIGHELRTPLAVVKSAIGLIKLKEKMGKLSKQELKKNVDAAEESLERELKIIETILGATKLDAKKLELHLEEVDVLDVVFDGMAAHKKNIEEKGLKLNYDKPGSDFPTAYADRTRIQEVFDNLLSNAIKYTEEGSITIELEKKADFVAISISDTGVGIPKKDIENLGKKFYRIKQYTQKKEGKMRMVRPGGSGLGLYVTFGYIKAMGGKVNVKSKMGEGSTFTFTVPVYKNQKPTQGVKQEKDVFKRMGMKNSSIT